jgi:hypothetical protein
MLSRHAKVILYYCKQYIMLIIYSTRVYLDKYNIFVGGTLFSGTGLIRIYYRKLHIQKYDMTD